MNQNILIQIKKYYLEAILIALMLFMYKNYIPVWLEGWTDADSFYAFGFFLIAFIVYLIKTNFEKLKNTPKSPNAWGIPILVAAMALYIAGYRASIHYLVNMSFSLCLAGLMLSLYGRKIFMMTILPIIMFAFSTEVLPLYRLTMPLSLFSAKLTSVFLSKIGLMSYYEGTMVTVNNYKLSVVAGCSGLKSLNSLVFISIIYCYFIDAQLFKKTGLVLFCFPLAIIMNVLRISTVGFYAIYNGYEGMKEFHDNIGIFVFMISLGIIILLSRLIENKQDEQYYES